MRRLSISENENTSSAEVISRSIQSELVQEPCAHLAFAFDFYDTTVFKRKGLYQGKYLS